MARPPKLNRAYVASEYLKIRLTPSERRGLEVLLFRKAGRNVTPSGLVRHFIHQQFAFHHIQVFPTYDGGIAVERHSTPEDAFDRAFRQSKSFEDFLQQMGTNAASSAPSPKHRGGVRSPVVPLAGRKGRRR